MMMDVVERRQRDKQERRESILEAAERAFIRKGVASTTMEDVAREAELSKGALYLYFQSKDELFLTIALRALSEFERLYGAALASTNESGFASLQAGLRQYVRYAKEQGPRFRAAMSWATVEYPLDDTSALFAEYRAVNGRIHQMATDVIVRGQADGSIRADVSPERLGVLLWGSTLGVLAFDENEAELRRRLPSAGDGALAFEFVELVLAGVRACAASQRK